MTDKDNKEFHRVFDEWRTYDFMASSLAMMGLIIGIVNYELDVNAGEV